MPFVTGLHDKICADDSIFLCNNVVKMTNFKNEVRHKNYFPKSMIF